MTPFAPRTLPRREGEATKPVCPRCRARMEQTWLNVKLRVGQPVPPREAIAVWECAACGIKRPRFE
jgi:hypothetical protein